ncbi:MAG: family 16 glycosylhydrolase [Muribaculaceae bacterium]|nr:family 16 glycosylhydrolase [Muribaculaceae bacterium]
MKRNLKNYIVGLAIALPLMATACSSKDDDGVQNPTPNKQVSITVSPESFSPDNSAQNLELTVNADVDWAIRTDASWISLRPAGGVKNQSTKVTITLTANTEFDNRTAVLNIVSGSNTIKSVEIVQGYAMSAYASVSSMMLSGEASEKEITVTSNGPWTISCDYDWLSISPTSGEKGETPVIIKASANEGEDSREANIVLSCGDNNSTISVSQLNYNVSAPAGYSLVWSDEFNYEGKPNSDWVIENQNAGWVNNELQTYTSREIDGKLTLEVKDGFLYINCFKGSDGKIYSGRMNAKPSTGWQYGYVEARINLPKGKGTWPAFWMMPSNVDWTNDPWPHCGEIDIMEEVGVDANHVSSSVHTGKYNHMINTQKTHEMYLEGAEGNFHTYALEWDEEKLITYVDGKVQLSITKAALGSDHDSWPFDRAFYPIVNLAWGGDWGGYAGVDESALPTTMIVDYVRIFQK